MINLWNWIKANFMNILPIFAPFMAVPVMIIKNWSSVKSFFTDLFSKITSGAKTAYNWMNKLNPTNWGKGKIVNPAMAAVPAHAYGGIMTRPHLGFVAEDGPEAIVPLGNRKRGLQVLSQAGAALGVSGENSLNYTINITVNSSANNSNSIASDVEKAVERVLQRIQSRERRTSFG